ncbi:hypothetical protein A4A49_62392, partial [Nicotiana attenuata]
MDIDYAIRKDEPHIIETNTPVEIALHEQWEWSNRLSTMFIKTKIIASIRGSVEQYTNVNALLNLIDEQFETSDKALASTLIMKFTSVRGVREHIIKMRDLAAQLKTLEIEMSETFLEVPLVMETGESAFMATQGKRTHQTKKKGKGKIPLETDIKKEPLCFFCRKNGHMKKDCTKFQKWLEKKG